MGRRASLPVECICVEVRVNATRYASKRRARLRAHYPIITLAEAMTEAARLATITGKIATVLASYAAVHIADGKPVWTDTNAIGHPK